MQDKRSRFDSIAVFVAVVVVEFDTSYCILADSCFVARSPDGVDMFVYDSFSCISADTCCYIE
jgi:hypothetical protein